MNKWYRKGLAKGILIVLAHIMAAAAAISVLWVASCPGVSGDMLFGERAQSYAESEGLTQQVFIDSTQILSNIEAGKNLETDGEFDPTRIVDIKEYYEDAVVTNQDINGIAYYLGDLREWAGLYDSNEVLTNDYGEAPDPIIVCQKTDGTYDYFYYSQMKEKIENGELEFAISDMYSSSEVLEMMRNHTMYEDSVDISAIQDAEGQVQYIDCWNYDGFWVEEKFAPVGAANLLEAVNENPQWSGKLETVFNMIYDAMRRIGSEVTNYEVNQDRLAEGDTNLAYMYVDKQEKKVYTNHAQYKDYDAYEENLESVRGLGKYVVVMPKLADFDTNLKDADANNWRQHVKSIGRDTEEFVYAVGVDTTFPIQDEYYTQNQSFETYAPRIRTVIVIGCLSAFLFLAITVWLTVVAGRRPGDEELYLHPFDRWKTEIAAIVIIGAWVMIASILGSALQTRSYYPISSETDGTVYYAVSGGTMGRGELVLAALLAVISCMAFLTGYLSLVRRIKARSLWSNSLLRWFGRFMAQLIRNIHGVWKVVLSFTGFVVIHWIAAAASYSAFPFLLMLTVEALAFIYLVRRAIGRQKILKGIRRISGGEVDYLIPLQGLYGEQLEIAKMINTIGEGMDAAVEASMKNERLKTDLITNVSHDIKTPLTSIINYIDLLKRENFTDPRILGYLDVLEAKAQRLKTLTEDVVEASKVSSGNISLEYMNINLVEMIQQTSGEFAEKFEKRNLKEILNLPEEEAVIHVDGRRMWRVLENIYNNAAKYAMEGTRIYADLTLAATEVIFSLKNISEQPLNIRADELTERFIRGDVSRSSEGSGLGLSIAKSLTEMQGGKFELYLDGDLFRVTVTFPRMIRVQRTNQT